MKSKWFELKEAALKLRRNGQALREIEKKLGIPRSTLNGWFKGIVLTQSQKNKLEVKRKKALVSARRKAVIWHNKQKADRINEAEASAKEFIDNFDKKDLRSIELALAMLYLGEGSKKNCETSLGSSDPMILKFFLSALKKLYKFDINKIRCELYLRADQNSDKIKKFWAKELGLPVSCFKGINIDKRTAGKATYENYKGVCHLRCGNVAIQRKLVFISRLFCEKAIKE